MKTVNRNAVKVDGQRLVLGKPAYTADLADPHGLVIKLLRSPHAHARIRSIDAGRARQLSGVDCVLTHEDLRRTARIRAFLGFLADALAKEAPLLEGRHRHCGADVAAAT